MLVTSVICREIIKRHIVAGIVEIRRHVVYALLGDFFFKILLVFREREM